MKAFKRENVLSDGSKTFDVIVGGDFDWLSRINKMFDKVYEIEEFIPESNELTIFAEDFFQAEMIMHDIKKQAEIMIGRWE